MRVLGVLYADGLGVPRDYALAAAWYRKAADAGDTIAMANLGSMYIQGLVCRRITRPR